MPSVAILHALEPPVDERDQPGFPARGALAAGVDEPRAHHGRQGQRHDRRDHDRANEREGEFGEQCACEPALEADRDVDCDEHHRHGDDWPCELAGRINRGITRRRSFLEMPVDVLDHDDRIVDNEPDSEDEGEQGEEIDREAEDQHHREGADQR